MCKVSFTKVTISFQLAPVEKNWFELVLVGMFLKLARKVTKEVDKI